MLLEHCVAIFLLCLHQALSYSITVTADSNECFVLAAEASSTVSGSFEIITGTILVLRAELYLLKLYCLVGDPNQIIVSVIGPPPLKYVHYESKLKFGLDNVDKDLSEGEFSFVANKSGDYQLCLASNDDEGKCVPYFISRLCNSTHLYCRNRWSTSSCCV